MDERYSVVFDSRESLAAERALAAAFVLSQPERDELARGGVVSKTVPECFVFKYRVIVDSEGVVWFEQA